MRNLAKCRHFLVGLWALCTSGCGDATPGAVPEGSVTETVSEALGTRASKAHAVAAFGRENLIHGIAGDSRAIFVTEPLQGNIVVHDRFSGEHVATLTPPEEGFGLPFALRVPEEGRLVVLDAGGFPNPEAPSVPSVHEYHYRHGHGRHAPAFQAELRRSVRFDGIPIVFAEDLEVLDDGLIVVSDVVLGALWSIDRTGSIAPVVSSDPPGNFLPALAACTAPGPVEIDGIPFAGAGNFAPGIGSLATDGHALYFGNGCLGGLHRISTRALAEPALSPAERAERIELVSPAPAGKFDVLKGLAFNRFDRRDEALYVLEPFELRLLRVDVRTGEREVLASDATLFNFPVASAFLPPPGRRTLVVSSDQEHRFAGINVAIEQDMFEPPFLVTKVRVPRR